MKIWTWLVIGGAAAACTTAARPAQACGGTFCDAGPMAQRVDQAYETVLFVRDGDYVEAHIQIAIDPETDAQQFAWVIPMPALPQFSVGSQPLFDALHDATTPNHSTDGPWCGWDDGGGFISRPDGGGAGFEPDVVFDETVGAFDVTVLQGGTVQGVMTWLGDNGYAQDPAAEPILADYLAEDNLFVAFKLTPSASTAEVHPIVLRYQGTEPCVPIRLTAIAAQDDMGVRAFFLGDVRFAPTNYRHVIPNLLRLRGRPGNPQYEEAVALAVDETPGGRAFMTEYAGSSGVVASQGLWDPRWSASVFEDAKPTEVMDLLNAQGLADCTGMGPCIVPIPTLVTMLRKYLPAPADINENDFYECLSCFEDQTDFAQWDGLAFATELDERVIAPGQHGTELLATWPYLTRLYTTISGPEMIVDPMFHETPDLPEVPLPSPTTTECLECDDGSAVAMLPDGRQVYMPMGAWPQFSDDMPWAERIEQIPAFGAPIVEQDNRPQIDALLAEHNATPCMGGGTGTTGDGYDGDGGGLSTTGSGATSSADTDGPGQNDNELGRGCGCSTPGPAAWAPWWLAGVLGLLRRRRAS